jgi:hypothetical protein
VGHFEVFEIKMEKLNIKVYYMNRPIQSRVQQKNNRENYNFPRALPSTMPTPIFHNHELYTFNGKKQNQPGFISVDRQFQNTRNLQTNTYQTNTYQTNTYQTNTYQTYKNNKNELNNQFKQNANFYNPQISNNLSSYQDRNCFQKNIVSQPVQNFKFKDNNLQQNYRMQNFMSLNGQFQNSEINKFYDSKPVDTRRDIYEDLRNEEAEKFIRIQGGPINNIVDNKGVNTRTQKQLVNNYVPIKKSLAVPLDKIK